ncbi:hypothetical protein NL676_011242 [Syzygium grande]|nr:hypothetical protein NL676_011242 [Syzygium grande]
MKFVISSQNLSRSWFKQLESVACSVVTAIVATGALGVVATSKGSPCREKPPPPGQWLLPRLRQACGLAARFQPHLPVSSGPPGGGRPLRTFATSGRY